MILSTAHSTAADASGVLLELEEQLQASATQDVELLYVFGSPKYDWEALLAGLGDLFPFARIAGGTSSMGVMTEQGFHSQDGHGMGLLAIHDRTGSYGVAHGELSPETAIGQGKLASTIETIAEDTLREALLDAKRPGELPALVFITQPPGAEEAILRGIENLLGGDVPVVGGSSADNTVSGDWLQFHGSRRMQNGLVVSVLFPEEDPLVAFRSGYEPVEQSGIVTKADARTLYEIDGEPAAEVYDRWTGGILGDAIADPKTVLEKTSLYPLGRIVGHAGSVPYFRLSHPERVIEGGALTLFSEVEEGDELHLMHGSEDLLVSRAGRTARSAIDLGEFPMPVKGALIVYCAGCMLTIQSKMDRVTESLRGELKGAPFLGIFTFGEQGCLFGGENRHGNLMISATIFRGEPGE